VLGFFGCVIVAMLVMLQFSLLQLSPIGFALGISIAWFYWVVVTVGVWRSATVYPLTDGGRP
jgi:hypothetical protein